MNFTETETIDHVPVYGSNTPKKIFAVEYLKSGDEWKTLGYQLDIQSEFKYKKGKNNNNKQKYTRELNFKNKTMKI